MRNSIVQTPGRPLARLPLLDDDVPETVEFTPRPATSRGLGSQFRTCLKQRANPLLQSSFTLKKQRPTSDAVKVFVRLKPVMADDLEHGRFKESVAVREKDGKLGIAVPFGNGKEHWFADYDSVFDNATNQEVFDEVGRDLLKQYIEGVNVSIMAYGQTGSGKTYTMFGSNEPDCKVQGLLHMVINHIDTEVGIGTPLVRATVSVFEVYNEELYSLLDASGVDRRVLSKAMVEYSHHKPKPVSSADEAISLVLEALQNRLKDATARNAASSRSHAFVKLKLEQRSLSHDDPGTVSTLYLVDLAGSESYNNASGSVQQRETIHINTALGALERVVHNMVNRSPHVPYRDSLLTQVLQEGLDPHNSRVALVTTVSRLHSDLTITRGTLGFALRARNIRTFAQVNHAAKRPATSCREEMQRQLLNLQAINSKLRQQLADLESAQHERSARERHLEAMRHEVLQLTEVHAELQRTSARQQHEAEAALEVERAFHQGTRQQLAELQRSYSDMQSKLMAAEEAARAEARAAADLRLQLTETGKEAAKLKGELAGARALAEEVQTQHRAAQEQMVKLKEQLTQIKGQLAVAEAGDTGYRRQLDRLRSQAESTSRSAAADATAMQDRINELEKQLEDVRKHLEQALQAAAEKAEELDQTRDELSRQASELRMARELADQQAANLDAVRQLAAQQAVELEEARKRAARQAAELEEARERTASQAAELELAREQAASHAVVLEQAREQVAQLQAAAAVGGDQDAASQEATLLRQELQEAEQRASEHASRVRQLLSNLAAVHDRRSDAESVASALRAAEDHATADELQADSGAQAESVLKVDSSKGATEGSEEQAVKRQPDMERSAGTVGREDSAWLSEEDSMRFKEALQQLEARTEQLASLEEELAETKLQLEAVAAEREALRGQLADQAAEFSRRVTEHAAELAAAVQEARAVSESTASLQLLPLQNECERLRATCQNSEHQLASMQAECERLREESRSAQELVVQLQAECEQLRESARWAEVSAMERMAKLEAQLGKEPGPRPETVRQLHERVRALEAEKKRAEADLKGQIELKEKLIRQLELMNHQLQSEIAKIRREALTLSEQQGGVNSPYTGPQLSARSDALSPAPGDDGSGTPASSVSAPDRPNRTTSGGGGILLLSRTTTGNVADLARNNAKALRDLSTPPPTSKMPPTGAPPAIPYVNLSTPTSAGGATPNSAAAGPGAGGSQTPISAGGGPPPADVLDLVTPCSTPGPSSGPPEPRLTPKDLPELDDGMMVVVRSKKRGQQDKLDSGTSAFRNQVNF